MNLELTYTGSLNNATLHLPISKSECNRLLIANYLSGNTLDITELSNADDTQTLKKCLDKIDTETTFDVSHAGTAFRFLTALFSIAPGTRIITGSERLKERPISQLVNGLRSLGAEIEYLEKENFAPLKITGKKIKGGNVIAEAGISSQFISALMLIAPYLENGLHIIFANKPVSFSYIVLTASVLKKLGIAVEVTEEEVVVKEGKYTCDTPVKPERDWTAASYWFEFVALADNLKIELPDLHENSLQGDVILKDIYTFFGVTTDFTSRGVTLYKHNHPVDQFAFDFTDSPDLAQTVIVTSSALKLPIILNGISTLHAKETDRVKALKNELIKIGVEVTELDNTSIEIFFKHIDQPPILKFSTYTDHRMAMCLAPLVLKFNKIIIENAEVVSKSYPTFWEDIKATGISIKEIN